MCFKLRLLKTIIDTNVSDKGITCFNNFTLNLILDKNLMQNLYYFKHCLKINIKFFEKFKFIRIFIF